MDTRRLIPTFCLAAGLAVAPLAAQQPQGQQPQGQQQVQGQQAQAKTVTITGCVREASDHPQLYALAVPEREAIGTTGRTPGEPTSGQAGQAAQPGQTGQAGQQRAGYFQLQASGDVDLQKHVGKRVQVTGQLTRFKNEKGADLILETIRPETITVTAIDLQRAPQLRATSVKEIGTCPTQPGGQAMQGTSGREHGQQAGQYGQTAQAQAGQQQHGQAGQAQAGQQQYGQEGQARGTSGVAAATVTTEELARNLEKYKGQQVSLEGSVAKVYGPRTFTLKSGATGRSVIVLSKTPANLTANSQVQVTGKVSEFKHPDIESEYSGYDVQAEWYEEFQGQPVVFAESVEARR